MIGQTQQLWKKICHCSEKNYKSLKTKCSSLRDGSLHFQVWVFSPKHLFYWITVVFLVRVFSLMLFFHGFHYLPSQPCLFFFRKPDPCARAQPFTRHFFHPSIWRVWPVGHYSWTSACKRSQFKYQAPESVGKRHDCSSSKWTSSEWVVDAKLGLVKNDVFTWKQTHTQFPDKVWW